MMQSVICERKYNINKETLENCWPFLLKKVIVLIYKSIVEKL